MQRRLAACGVGERTDQLTVALQWMLDGYEAALRVMPEGSQARALLDGAYGKAPQLAKEILG